MYTSHKHKLYWLFIIIISSILILLLSFSPTIYAQQDNKQKLSNESLLQKFEQIFFFIQQNYVEEVDANILIDGAIEGMFNSLDDPYSAYLDEKDMLSLTDTTSGEFGGVGLYIQKLAPNETQKNVQEWVEIISPIEGTPAFRAGLRSRDLITKIEEESTVDMSIDEVVSKLRGIPHSSVQVTILRNEDTRFTVSLTRAIIQIPTVRYDEINKDIGYIRIIQFTPRTTENVKEAIHELQNTGHKNMIIDLRTNPGGLLSAVVNTADLFFDDGLLVGTDSRIEEETYEYFANETSIVPSHTNLVVLINEGTASAAEILAGAFKDYNRAVLVGENTFGKGSVQQIRQLGDEGFRLTMAKYYTPSNTFIDKIGISPDIEIKDIEMSEEEDKNIIRIQEEKRIEKFLDSHNNAPTDKHILSFIKNLEKEEIHIHTRIIRKLIKTELEIRLNNPSIFDLDYDIILQEAVNILRENRTQEIIDNRKPVQIEQ